jgi:hypothetical protein
VPAQAENPAKRPSASPSDRLAEIRGRVAELLATALAAVASLQQSAISGQHPDSATRELKADGRRLRAGERSEPAVWPADLNAERKGPGVWGRDPEEVRRG